MPFDDEDDVEFTGATGDDIARNAPHSRHDCLECRFDKSNKEMCKKACEKCYCWVCDEVWTACKQWDSHCQCDGGLAWMQERQAKQRRKKEAEDKAARSAANPGAQDSTADVNARFARAASGEADAAAQAADDANGREGRGEDEEVEAVFTPYQPQHYKEGQAHPDAVVETTSLSFAEMPKIGYALTLPRGLLKPKTASNPFGGALSNLQLETVLYACQRHEQRLHSGARAGFFLGDGVGLGKGRQLAGIILENVLRLRTRHVWVSVSADLYEDAKRDLNDLGRKDIVVRNLTEFPLHSKIPIKEGVVFLTYAALVSKGEGGKRRIDQILKWLKEGGGDGCVLFDEAHKAKNLVPDEDKINKKTGKPIKSKNSTKTAEAVHELQEKLPDARFVYCSATGASDIAHMAYMERLGLWGSGTSFSSFSQFKDAIGKGGTGAMELVALDMKRRGFYISRQLSFAAAEFDTEIVDVERYQRLYDDSASWWQMLHGCIQHALITLKVKDKKKHPAKSIMSQFWGAHQRFFRQLCMSMKVDRTVQLAQEALQNTKTKQCVVIGLQSTGEARLKEAIKDGLDLEEFCGMDSLLKYMIDRFPTGDYLKKYPEPKDDDANADGDLDAEEIGGHAAAGVRRRREWRRGRAGYRQGGSSGSGGGGGGRQELGSDGEVDDGSDLDDFIADDDEEEESGSEASVDEDGLETGRRSRTTKLPKVLKRMKPERMRKLLTDAEIDHKQCTDRLQLEQRLRLLEERSRQAASNGAADACAECGCYSTSELLRCKGEGCCGKAYHAYCLSPALKAMPTGDWLCPECVPEPEAAEEEEMAQAPHASASGRRASSGSSSSLSTEDGAAEADARSSGDSGGRPRRRAAGRGADRGSAISLDSSDEEMADASGGGAAAASAAEEDDWSLKPGTEVQLRGLVARAELNGQLGTAVQLQEGSADGRWEVTVEGESNRLALKPENLVRPPRPNRAAATAAASGGDSDEEEDAAMLGKRITVFWNDPKLVSEPAWFEGQVIAVSSSRGHKIRYECDGEERWEDLSSAGSKWKFLSTRKAPGAAGSAAKPKPKRRAVVSDDDSDAARDAPRQRGAKRAASAGVRRAAKKAKGKRRAADDSDSASDWEMDVSDNDDESDVDDGGDADSVLGLSSDDEPASKRRRGKQRASAAKPKPKQARAKGKGRMDDEDDEAAGMQDELDSLLGDDDMDGQGSDDEDGDFQHSDPSQIKQLQGLKRQLRAASKKLNLPDAPLDRLIHALGGSSMVAELTGRSERLERNAEGKTVPKKRSADLGCSAKQVNIEERKAFMDGRKRVAIISEAASSGISLQADRRVKNQAQRVHITLELPWSADQAIQQCGRTHRSNQVCGPKYVLMMTACGGERRFASAVAKRLRALGALTKGDRRAADASSLSDFDVDTEYGVQAANRIIETVLNPQASKMHPPDKYVREVLGLSGSDAGQLQQQWGDYLDEAEELLARLGMKAEDSGVRKFLNRLLGVQLDMQNKIFAHFISLFEHFIKQAKANFEYKDGVVDISAQSGVRVAPSYPITLANDEGGRPLQHWKLQVDRGISWADAKAILEKHRRDKGGVLEEGEGIWVDKSALQTWNRPGNRVFSCKLLIRKPASAWAVGNPIPIYKVLRPSVGLGTDITLWEQRRAARLVWPKPSQEGSASFNETEAQEAWTKCFDTFKDGCAHGPNCAAKKAGQECYVGRRMLPRHVVTGSVLPHWGPLQDLVGYTTIKVRDKDGRQQYKQVSNMSIVRGRASNADGSEVRLVGVEVTHAQSGQLVSILDPAARAARAAANAAAGVGGGGSSGDAKPNVKPDVKPKKRNATSAAVDAMRKKRSHEAAADADPFDNPSASSTAGAGPSGASGTSGSLRPGQAVVVQGLKARPEFNGKPGVVKMYDAMSSRYNVVLLADDAPGGVYGDDSLDMTLNIKRDNLLANGWASRKTLALLGLSA